MVWALAIRACTEAIGEEAFHALHALHLFLSAVVTAAVYRRHGAGYAKALAVGLAGSVPICSVSDIAIPFLGGRLLGLELELHACLLEHPQMPLASALLGAVAGLGLSTKLKEPDLVPHSGHVMVSVLASLLYLSAFFPLGFEALMAAYPWQVFAIVFAAVLLPCCTSDIVVPIAALPSHLGAPYSGDHGWLERLRRRAGLK